MNNRRNHNCGKSEAAPTPIRHLYLHIPFCARICPYCAFYKELLDRSQTERFCEAVLCELKQHTQDRPALRPSKIDPPRALRAAN